MRFGAIFSAVLSFGLLVAAAPAASVQDVVVARSFPAELTVREVAAPVARFAEERSVVGTIVARDDFLTTCQNAQEQINNICGQITVQANANADISVIVALFAQLTAQLNIILSACASISLTIDVNACVTIILQIYVTICTCLKLCLSVYVGVSACVSGVAAIVAILVNILAAITARIVLFGAAFLLAAAADLALFLSVGLNLSTCGCV